MVAVATAFDVDVDKDVASLLTVTLLLLEVLEEVEPPAESAATPSASCPDASFCVRACLLLILDAISNERRWIHLLIQRPPPRRPPGEMPAGTPQDPAMSLIAVAKRHGTHDMWSKRCIKTQGTTVGRTARSVHPAASANWQDRRVGRFAQPLLGEGRPDQTDPGRVSDADGVVSNSSRRSRRV